MQDIQLKIKSLVACVERQGDSAMITKSFERLSSYLTSEIYNGTTKRSGVSARGPLTHNYMALLVIQVNEWIRNVRLNCQNKSHVHPLITERVVNLKSKKNNWKLLRSPKICVFLPLLHGIVTLVIALHWEILWWNSWKLNIEVASSRR